MGPGSEKNQARGIVDPPMFSPQDDMSTWRREVANWVDLITAGADNGEDKLYKTVKATLGTQLYNRGLPRAQKSMVDYAQLMKAN